MTGDPRCISVGSLSARPLPRGFTGHVAHPSRSIRRLCTNIDPRRSRGMCERRRWRFDALFRGDFQRALECELNLARGFLARVTVRHDAGPFERLGQ